MSSTAENVAALKATDDELLKQYNKECEDFSEHLCDGYGQCYQWMDEIYDLSKELTRRGIEHRSF